MYIKNEIKFTNHKLFESRFFAMVFSMEKVPLIHMTMTHDNNGDNNGGGFHCCFSPILKSSLAA